MQALNESLLSYNLDEKEYKKAIEGQVCILFIYVKPSLLSSNETDLRRLVMAPIHAPMRSAEAALLPCKTFFLYLVLSRGNLGGMAWVGWLSAAQIAQVTRALYLCTVKASEDLKCWGA